MSKKAPKLADLYSEEAKQEDKVVEVKEPSKPKSPPKTKIPANVDISNRGD